MIGNSKEGEVLHHSLTTLFGISPAPTEIRTQDLLIAIPAVYHSLNYYLYPQAELINIVSQISLKTHHYVFSSQKHEKLKYSEEFFNSAAKPILRRQVQLFTGNVSSTKTSASTNQRNSLSLKV